MIMAWMLVGVFVFVQFMFVCEHKVFYHGEHREGHRGHKSVFSVTFSVFSVVKIPAKWVRYNKLFQDLCYSFRNDFTGFAIAAFIAW